MIFNHRALLPQIILAFFAVSCLWSQTGNAYIHAPAVSTSHELEEHSADIHEYLHDHYNSGYGSHELEEAAEALHETLHLTTENSATETQVIAALKATRSAWREFRRQIRSSGLLSTDDTLKQMFRDTRSVFRAVHFLLRNASKLDKISEDAPSASHDLEEATHELHEFLHDNYDSSYGAHDLEEAAHALHDGLHDWGEGTVSEDAIADLFDVVHGSWRYFRFQLDRADLLKGPDRALNQLVHETKKAFKKVKSLLRKAD